MTTLQQLQQYQRQKQLQQSQSQKSPNQSSQPSQSNQPLVQLNLHHPDDLCPSNKNEHQEEKESYNDILSLFSQELNSEKRKDTRKEILNTHEELILSPIE